jgi:glycosyltransferase involved in cell wall biosynthesis
VRVCIVYDCLYPHTVGGAERWYRNLAERLVADGHEVTYLTLRQWPRGADPGVPGVDVRAVGPRMSLYRGPGERRVVPPLVFGLGVLLHLLRHHGHYDVVHTASFPYFSLLAATVVRRLLRVRQARRPDIDPYRLVVDWFEVWTLEYWRGYLGTIGGTVGWLIQRICALAPQRAFCFSALHARRLRAEGLRGAVTMLSGLYAGPIEPVRNRGPADQRVVFAGRMIPEKQAPVVVDAIAAARRALPELRGSVIGDGPERDRVRRRVAELGLEGIVDVPGFIGADEVQEAIGRALCMLSPSRREGYGMVVIEAAQAGTPSIVVAEPDNAAVELIEEGENGFVASDDSAETLAAAIVQVHEGGAALRESTAAWFSRNAPRLSLAGSLDAVTAAYGESVR